MRLNFTLLVLYVYILGTLLLCENQITHTFYFFSYFFVRKYWAFYKYLHSKIIKAKCPLGILCLFFRVWAFCYEGGQKVGILLLISFKNDESCENRIKMLENSIFYKILKASYFKLGS